MSLASKAKTSERRAPAGPTPKITMLIEALNEEDSQALLDMLQDKTFSTPKIREILINEQAEILEQAEAAKGDEAKRLEELAELMDISSWSIGRHRRELRNGFKE